MCLAQGPQRSDAGAARTRGPSVSSQALYRWATALPKVHIDRQTDGRTEAITISPSLFFKKSMGIHKNSVAVGIVYVMI